ncbi:hypothetical protein, partial [Pseudomonas sp. FEN]
WPSCPAGIPSTCAINRPGNRAPGSWIHGNGRKKSLKALNVVGALKARLTITLAT